MCTGVGNYDGNGEKREHDSETETWHRRNVPEAGSVLL